MTDARSVCFSLCVCVGLEPCPAAAVVVLVIETSARFALLRLIRVGPISEAGRVYIIAHGRRTSSLALAPAP